MQHTKKIINWVYEFSSRDKFFNLIVIFFTINVFWGAFSFIYPMVFDEYVHFGMTKLYSQQWSPFIWEQPPEASLFGDITRDPSYLYSYLLSFSFRLIHIFVKSEIGLIILLRLLNASIVVFAIFLYRKLFLSWGISNRSINFVTLAFASTMIVPLIASHINYDNLMFLMTAVFLILGTKILSSKDKLFTRIILFISIGFLTTIVKHNFLPIFIVTVIYVGSIAWLNNRRCLTKYLKSVWQDRPNSLFVVFLATLIIISFGLFIERHGQNLVRYKTVAPTCDRIQPEYICKDFGPWYRNQNNLLNKPSDALYGNPFSFTQHWVSKIMRGFFAPFSHTPTQVVSEHEPFGPIVRKPISPPQIIFAYSVLFIGMISVLINFKQLWAKPYIRLSLLIISIYMIVLWLFNFQLYQKLGAAQAIQARYTYPILLLIFVVFLEGFKNIIQSARQRKFLITIFLVFFVWGGGITGYLIRADDTWYWQNHTVISVNRVTQEILKKIVIH